MRFFENPIIFSEYIFLTKEKDYICLRAFTLAFLTQQSKSSNAPPVLYNKLK